MVLLYRLVVFQWVAGQIIHVLHYIPVSCGRAVESYDHLSDACRSGVCTECLRDGALPGSARVALSTFRMRPFLRPVGRGDTLLAFDEAPQGSPAILLALLVESLADGLNQLLGDDGDKEVAVDTFRGLVEDEGRPKRVFELAEHCLHAGDGAVGARQRCVAPVT